MAGQGVVQAEHVRSQRRQNKAAPLQKSGGKECPRRQNAGRSLILASPSSPRHLDLRVPNSAARSAASGEQRRPPVAARTKFRRQRGGGEGDSGLSVTVTLELEPTSLLRSRMHRCAAIVKEGLRQTRDDPGTRMVP